MEKKIYKTIVQVEILSQEPLNDDFCNDLSGIAYEIVQGDLSGIVDTKVMNQELIGEEAIKEIINQGSDPEFFMMDKNGNEIEDNLYGQYDE